MPTFEVELVCVDDVVSQAEWWGISPQKGEYPQA